MKVFRAVLEDKEFSRFGRVHLERMKNPMIIWEHAPASLQSCMNDDFGFRVGSSASFGYKLDETVLIATKMYYDQDAAFVELDFWQPNNLRWPEGQGKTGDFFLRNKNGWKVEQRALGER